ncbi:MAG: AMP-binding protein [Deltaproteobacteria bacterium]|nr:AMP-binding protein [Deltaproteobacteria bacterium]
MVSKLEHNLVQRVAVGDIFRRNARHNAGKEAIVERRGDDFIRLTYGELNRRMNQFAHAVMNLGFSKGDRVALIGPNSIEYVIALYGITKTGIIMVPLNPILNPEDIKYMINHSEAKAVIVDDAFIPMVEQIREGCPNVGHYISIPASKAPMPAHYVDFYAFIDGQPDNEPEAIIWERDPMWILYTSGTTARAKGVVISHLTVYITSLANLVEYEIPRRFVGSIVLPMFHAAQQACTTSFFHVGARTVLFRTLFDITEILEAIQREKISFVFVLPMIWRAMLDHPNLKDYDVSSVERAMYAMTPMDQRTLEQIGEVFTKNLYLGTGRTEFFPSSENFKPEWQLKKKGNYWGEPAITVETVVMDDNGNILPRGEVGEIVRRGPAHLIEYLKDSHATDETRKYGWDHSEDIGYFDEDGLLAFVDRKKDMIKTGGENVPSIKVEKTLLADARIQAAAVVGLPHERWVEAITAFVVRQPGEELTEEDVITWCKERLGGFEVPKKVVFLDVLPMTSTGKIQKNVIKQQYTDLYAE